ncbi:MAG TPA: SRPBCC domain-containing protein [Fimbriimonadaceae bacterium]|nr:SRPBCC domain-containing protein [Fimbriimonadaceae bacterium]
MTTTQDFRLEQTFAASPKQVLDAVNDVRGWWQPYVVGETDKKGERFTVRFSEDGEIYVSFRIVELDDHRVEWLVEDSDVPGFEDPKEWNGTTAKFSVHPDGGKTRLVFEHQGLTPEVQCYNDCSAGWTYYLGESLAKLITGGKGRPGDRREQ